MPVDFRLVLTCICVGWLLIVYLTVSHRRMLFEEARKILTPDLMGTREILEAAALSGEVHRKDKIEAAIKYLDTLIVRG